MDGNEIIGFTNGDLTVLREDEGYNTKTKQEVEDGARKNYTPKYICQCSCGNVWSVYKTMLQSSHCPSCCPKCSREKHQEFLKKWRNTEEGQKAKEKALKGLYKKSQERRKENSYNLDGDYAIVTNDKGEEFWVDKEDVPKIKHLYWYYNDQGYVIASEGKKQIRLHRLLMGVLNNPNVDVNHKQHPPRQGQKKDNRKQNLEVVSRSINNMNCALGINNKSGVTGVCWDNSKQRWRAYITLNRKRKELGIFKEKEKAIQARKKAEEELFGEHRYDALNP